jgi:hypothetical protein
MSATAVVRFCNDCKEEYEEGHKHCRQCPDKCVLHIRCPGGTWSGRYDHWYTRHRPTCPMCNPDLAIQSDEKHESKTVPRVTSLYGTSDGTLPICVSVVSVIKSYSDLEFKIC